MAVAKTKTKVKLKLKRGDTVEVIAGKDKGKRGTIREVLTEKMRVKVSDVNIVKRHMKAGARGAHQRHRGIRSRDPHLQRRTCGPQDGQADSRRHPHPARRVAGSLLEAVRRTNLR